MILYDQTFSKSVPWRTVSGRDIGFIVSGRCAKGTTTVNYCSHSAERQHLSTLALKLKKDVTSMQENRRREKKRLR